MDCNGLLCTGESPGTTDWDPLARAIRPLPSTSRNPKNVKKTCFFFFQKSIFSQAWCDFCPRVETRDIKAINKILNVIKAIFGGPYCGLHWQKFSEEDKKMEKIGHYEHHEINHEISQELRILFTITLDCQVTNIAMNSGSQS